MFPPQSLWNHGCCDLVFFRSFGKSSPRLNLFGITGAATAAAFHTDASFEPPQSLWNHGCCDLMGGNVRELQESRLNLFGITGAAT